MGRRGATRTLRVTRYREGGAERVRESLAVEEPLEIRVAWTVPGGERRSEQLTVTMRTPGDDFDLVAGFLFAEGVVSGRDELGELTYCRGDDTQEYNVVEARLRAGVGFDAPSHRRHFMTSSSCGVCGKASLDAVADTGCVVLPGGTVRVEPALLPDLPRRLRDRQEGFHRTGGLHAAGLFTPEGELVDLREDVGRHNAVDKVLGHEFLGPGLPATERVLVVSGRTSFEIIQKAVRAGVPVVVAVGAPSSLAVELARRFGQTLVGFARDGGFNVYAGAERLG
ncbi:MAG: formate dehydrogenase accessory sulfurtransferase FdhD [Gemmatimonadota bacterium]|nr:formate dehydrogenase accessory sulfurtransferase FdhD [Gemmatimonadota bacterium]